MTGPRDKLEEVVGRPPLPITSNKVGEDGGVTVDTYEEETITTYDRCTVGSNDPTVAASEQFESGYDIESQITVDSEETVIHEVKASSKRSIGAPRVTIIDLEKK